MVTLLAFLVIIFVFWFLLIRPQQRRQRQVREMQAQLGVGDHVILTSGIYAEVREVTDDHILVDIADSVTVKIARAAIGQVLPQDQAEDRSDAVSLDKPTDEPVEEPVVEPSRHEENE